MNVIPVQPPHGYDEIVAHYGDPKIRIVDGEWKVDLRWEATNLTTIHHPLIPAWQGHKLYVHKLIAEPTLLLLDDWQALGDYTVESLGCFSPRAKAGGDDPSTHSWAIALDLNPDRNRLIVKCPTGDPRRTAPGATDIPPSWAAAAIARGYFHGANFTMRFDPMHFQLCTGY